MSALSSASSTRPRRGGCGRGRRRRRGAAPAVVRVARRAASAAPPRRRRRRARAVDAWPRGAADALGRQVRRRRTGRVTVKRACRARARSRRRTVPPCSLTSSCTSASPMPLPSMVRPLRTLDAVEALEQSRQLVRRDAGAGVAHRRARHARRRAGAALTAISPSNVNLKALESRLRTIFSHMSRST